MPGRFPAVHPVRTAAQYSSECATQLFIDSLSGGSWTLLIVPRWTSSLLDKIFKLRRAKEGGTLSSVPFGQRLDRKKSEKSHPQLSILDGLSVSRHSDV